MVVSYRNSTSNHNLPTDYITSTTVVSYRNSTSNHNPLGLVSPASRVVSYRNSTSNHNRKSNPKYFIKLYLIEILHQTTTFVEACPVQQALYLIEILHQTTTMFVVIRSPFRLYLIEILHQTTTNQVNSPFASKLYLIEILHQTTTVFRRLMEILSCILSKFYIKPQRDRPQTAKSRVVSYRNSTSNHNIG